MVTPTDIDTLEARARENGISIGRLCRRADTNHSNWNKWKAGKLPRQATWDRVVCALDQLIAERTRATAA